MVAPGAAPPFAGADALPGAPVPPVLAAFWGRVGALDFVWGNRAGPMPDLFGVPAHRLEPLCLDGADRLPAALDTWRERIETGDIPATACLRIDLAPDRWHKAHRGGGSPYGVTLDEAADPLFGGDHFTLRFADDLRLAFRWGGFPGLAATPRSARIDDRVAALTECFAAF